MWSSSLSSIYSLPCVAGLVRNFLKCLTRSWLVTLPLCSSINAWISLSDNSRGSDMTLKSARTILFRVKIPMFLVFYETQQNILEAATANCQISKQSASASVKRNERANIIARRGERQRARCLALPICCWCLLSVR